MGTRANIIVAYKSSLIVLYRHWDGYPAETGADLIRTLDAVIKEDEGSFIDGYGGAGFVRRLLELANSNGGKRFEITDDLHGDIEHAYRINWPNSLKPLEIIYAPINSESDLINWEHRVSVKTYSRKDFRDFINHEIDEVNQRIRKMKKETTTQRLTKAEELQHV